MPELPGSFWGGWIVVLTVGSLALLVMLVLSVYFFDKKTDETHETVWDETIREGNHPAPLWWFWLITSLLVFSVIYLLLYPGLGQYRGALQWSQGHQLAHSRERYAEEFTDTQLALGNQTPEQLALDPRAMDAAKSLFRVHCGTCHGDDARGLPGHFPDLTDDAWQWGGTAEQINTTITQGRLAAMPPWREVLGTDAVTALADYVVSLAQTGAAESAVHRAAETYRNNCSVCHGVDGGGNPVLGAPDLTDDYWLYGGTREAIFSSIANGRQGEMPAHGKRLSAVQIHLLTAWLLNLQSSKAE